MYDFHKLLDGLPPGSYVLAKDKEGKLVPQLVYLDEPEWVTGEMPFTLPYAMAA